MLFFMFLTEKGSLLFECFHGYILKDLNFVRLGRMYFTVVLYVCSCLLSVIVF